MPPSKSECDFSNFMPEAAVTCILNFGSLDYILDPFHVMGYICENTQSRFLRALIRTKANQTVQKSPVRIFVRHH